MKSLKDILKQLQDKKARKVIYDREVESTYNLNQLEIEAAQIQEEADRIRKARSGILGKFQKKRRINEGEGTD